MRVAAGWIMPERRDLTLAVVIWAEGESIGGHGLGIVDLDIRQFLKDQTRGRSAVWQGDVSEWKREFADWCRRSTPFIDSDEVVLTAYELSRSIRKASGIDEIRIRVSYDFRSDFGARDRYIPLSIRLPDEP